MLLKTVLLSTTILGVQAQVKVNDPTLPATDNLRILYQTTAPGKHFVHHTIDADGTQWTKAPGDEMKPSTLGGDYAKENGWFELEISKSNVPSGPHSDYPHFNFVFATQDESNQLVWNNNNNTNYHADRIAAWATWDLDTQNPLRIKNNVAGDATIRVLYQSVDAPVPSWSGHASTSANIHYRPCGGQWTAVPGVRMTAISRQYVGPDADPLWFQYDFAASCVELVFNDESFGHWDNNNGKNYKIEQPGTYAFKPQLPFWRW